MAKPAGQGMKYDLDAILEAIDAMESDDLIQVKQAAADKLESMKFLVIEQLKTEMLKKMDAFGITAEQLGLFGSLPATGKKEQKSSDGPPKYRDPETGETWSGRGRPAQWMQRKLAEGKKQADFINPDWKGKG